jgi:hypothetical protein
MKMFVVSGFTIIVSASFSFGAVINLPKTPFIGYPYKGGFWHTIPEGPLAGFSFARFQSSYSVLSDGFGSEIWTNTGLMILAGFDSVESYKVETLISNATGHPRQLSKGDVIGPLVLGASWQSQASFESESGPPSTPGGEFLAFRIKKSPSEYYYGYEVLRWEPNITEYQEIYTLAGLGKLETSVNTAVLVVPEPSGILLVSMGVVFLGRRRR